jgi:hypothetical protein
MTELCPATRRECGILSEMRKAHALRREEDPLADSHAKELFEEHYTETLSDVQAEHCSEEVCGLLSFNDLALSALALASTEQEVKNVTLNTVRDLK